MPETYDLEIAPISTYLFELPGTPEGEEIEVTISFFRDTKHNVFAESYPLAFVSAADTLGVR